MNVFSLQDMVEREVVPGYFLKAVHSENVTLAFWRINADHSLPSHSHPHEQIVSMVEGSFEFCIDGAKRVLSPGTVVIIPPNTPHSGKALSDCRMVDTFYPVRQDMK